MVGAVQLLDTTRWTYRGEQIISVTDPRLALHDRDRVQFLLDLASANDQLGIA
jgi:hypothetical protein